jgi:hypothetical protein
MIENGFWLRFLKGRDERQEKSMKRALRAKSKRLRERNLFAELTEGMEALSGARRGNRTLQTHSVETKPSPNATARESTRRRESVRISRKQVG